MANVVMTTHWTGGDVYPFIRIGSALNQRYGHKVTLVTHSYYEESARRAGLEFTPFDTPQEWAEFLIDDAKIGNPLANLQGVVDFRTKYQNESRFMHEYGILAPHCAAEDTVLFVRHVDSLAALAVAERLRVPIVTTYMAPSFLSQVFLDNEIFGEQLVEMLNSFRSALKLPPVRTWLQMWSAPKRVVGLWPAWFDNIAGPSQQGVTPVGFALDHASQTPFSPEVESFLAEHKTPILISGGTGKQLKAGFYDVCVEACAVMNLPAILVTQYEDLVPRNLPDNVRWFKYLPLAPLMSRMRAIMHHGGVNTCAEALAAGIPQLVLGYYYDRPGNGARLKALGVAEYLPPVSWQPGIIAEALTRLTAESVRRRCEELAARIRSEDVMSNIDSVIQGAVRNTDLLIDLSASKDKTQTVGTIDPERQTLDLPKEKRLSLLKELSRDQRAIVAQILRERNRTV